MKTIVIGWLHTDLVATGIKKFPKPGQLVFGKELHISPGGKSRNIADMIARLAPKNSVAMVGRTVRDPYGLWRQPVDALAKIGVNTDYINIVGYAEAGKLPGIALIPVDDQGNNQIFVLPGIGNDFSTNDIDRATALFEEVGASNGNLVLTLECPLETAVYAVEKANKHGLKVMFDPGGIQPEDNVEKLVRSGIYLIKPNEHEAKMLTGIDVSDFDSAQKAAAKLQAEGIENVLITHGAKGAYLFAGNEQVHIPIPDVKTGDDRDETGCGDQTMAALCALLQDGRPIRQAAEHAVLAGTLQFHRSGIKPLSQQDMADI